MTDNSLQQAITFVKAKQMEEARGLLQQVLRDDPKNETAWLWYAATVASPGERIEALELCLRFNPGAERASAALAKLRSTGQEEPPPGEPAAAQLAHPKDGAQPAEREAGPPSAGSQPTEGRPAKLPSDQQAGGGQPLTQSESGSQLGQPSTAQAPAQPEEIKQQPPSAVQPPTPQPAARPGDQPLPAQPATSAKETHAPSQAERPAPAFTVPPDQVTDEEYAAAQAAVDSELPVQESQPENASAQPAVRTGPPAHEHIRPLGDPTPPRGARPSGEVTPVGHRKRSFVAQPLSARDQAARDQAAQGQAASAEAAPRIKPLKIQEERRRQRMTGEIPPIPTARQPDNGAQAGGTPAGAITGRESNKAAFRTLLLLYAAISALGLLVLLIFLAGLIIALQSGG